MTIQIFGYMDCCKRKLNLKYVMQSTPFYPTGRIKRGNWMSVENQKSCFRSKNTETCVMTHTTKENLNIKYLNVYLLSRFYEDCVHVISLKFFRNVVAHSCKIYLRCVTNTQWHRTTHFRLQTRGNCSSNRTVLLGKNVITSYKKNVAGTPFYPTTPFCQTLPYISRKWEKLEEVHNSRTIQSVFRPTLGHNWHWLWTGQPWFDSQML
jgi:hypothetical protein